jgi:hypothetical protein
MCTILAMQAVAGARRVARQRSLHRGDGERRAPTIRVPYLNAPVH